MASDLEKLNPVQLLLALEEAHSQSEINQLKVEIKSRNLSREQLIKYNEEKEYVLKIRKEKAVTPLSPVQKIIILITPFGIR